MGRKHAGLIPEIRAQIAKTQARKYIDNKAITCLGAANTFSGSFYIQCGEIAIYVEYSTPTDGAILYTVEAVENYNGNYFRKFLTLEQRNKNKQMMTTPNYFTQTAFFPEGGGGAMMAMCAITYVGCYFLLGRNQK